MSGANNIPENLHYTEDHEWLLIEGDQGSIGITHFAQSALGDIVFVDLPAVGTKLEKGKTFGVVESIKSVSDLYAPVSGTVTAVNEDAQANPDSLNQDPYGAWLVKITLSDKSQVNDLMNAAKYAQHCDSNAH